MLQRILGAHPEIHTVSEPWIALHPLYALAEGLETSFDLLPAKTAVGGFLRGIPDGEAAYREGVRRMLTYLYSLALEQSNRRILLDKTPRYYFIIRELRQVFPRAKIVLLLRNPLAVLVSILKTWCKSNPTIELSYQRSDLMTAPEAIVRAMRDPKVDAAVVRYEELVTEPEPTLRRLCESLGVAFHPEMVAYGEADGAKARWQYGDQGTVYREKAPAAERANRWRQVLKDAPEWARWAHGYLQAIGPEVVQALGYNYDSLRQELPPVLGTEEWRALMRPPIEAALNEARQELVARTTALEKAIFLLEQRTAELERVSRELQERTMELVETRGLLAERTFCLDADLDDSREELLARTTVLENMTLLLEERTAELDKLSRELQERTAELVETRSLLAERTVHLDAELDDARKELTARTTVLEDTTSLLKERTVELEIVSRELQERTAELVETRSLLAERTVHLDAELDNARKELTARTTVLEDTTSLLEERTVELERVSRELQERTAELVETRSLLAERTVRLERALEGTRPPNNGDNA
jgi:hypothetical protein